MSNDSILLDPIRLGEIQLPNRIVMASMTRARTENTGLVPIPLQAEYYRQRASAGLILTEGTWPSKEAIGAINVPGLFNREQAEGPPDNGMSTIYALVRSRTRGPIISHS